MRITCLEHLSAFKLRLYVDYASNPATAIYLLFKLHCFNLHLATRFQAVYEEPDRHKRCWLLVMLDCLESLVTYLCIGNAFIVRYFNCLDVSVVLDNFVPMAKEISLDCNHKLILSSYILWFFPSYVIIYRKLRNFIHITKKLFSVCRFSV